MGWIPEGNHAHAWILLKFSFVSFILRMTYCFLWCKIQATLPDFLACPDSGLLYHCSQLISRCFEITPFWLGCFFIEFHKYHAHFCLWDFACILLYDLSPSAHPSTFWFSLCVEIKCHFSYQVFFPSFWFFSLSHCVHCVLCSLMSQYLCTF